MKRYSHIFFDMDRTLWDFDRNSLEAITDLFFRHNLDAVVPGPDAFAETYHEINLQLWALYRTGDMTKEVLRIKRFQMSFAEYGIHDDKLAERFGDEYLQISPTKTILVPHTREILDYLAGRY